jgi:hypothetical protein
MSLLLNGGIEGQDLAAKLSLAIEHSVKVLVSTTSAEFVKKELAVLVELIKPTHFANSSLSSSTPPSGLLSVYKPKDFLRLQEIFKDSGHIKHLLRVIFDEVLVSWSFAFSSVERDSLIHSWTIHCSAVDILYSLNEALSKLHSKSQKQEQSSNLNSTLLALPTRSVTDSVILAHAHQLEMLLLSFFGLTNDQHTSGLLRMLYEISRTPSASQHGLIWTQLISLICNIPVKLFNILKKETNEFFRPEQYFSVLTIQMSQSLEELMTAIGFPFFSIWMSKMEGMGHVERVISVLDPTQKGSERFALLSKIFVALPPVSVDRVLIAILQNQKVSHSPQLLEFMRATMTEWFQSVPAARFFLTEKLFASCSLPWWVLRQVLAFLNEMRLGPWKATRDHDWWIDMLEKMALRAGQPNFIKVEPYERQRRLNRLLILVLDKLYVSRQSLEASQLMMTLMATIQELLNQPSQKLAFLGMRLGEALSIVLDPANPLNFDGPKYDETDEPDQAPSEAVKDESLENFEFLPSTTSSAYLDPTEDYFTFLEKRNVAESTQSENTQRFRKGKFVQLSLDDDLRDVAEVKTPLYLRECLTSLRSDEPKVLEVVMKILGPLISSRPDDLPELAVTLASTLLHVVNNYDLPDFDQQKLDAMTGLAAYVPEKVIPFLIKEFYAPNYSLHERFVMLDTLSQAAQQLSEHRVDPRPEYNPIALKVLNLDKRVDTPKKNIEIVDSSLKIKASSTRRWASEKKMIQTFQNRFAAHLIPCLQILHAKDYPKGWSMLMSETRLLGKLVYTVSVFLDCAGVSNPDFETSAREIVEIAWKVRYHEDPFVRRALLLTIGALIRIVPAWVLFEKIATEMNELVAWLDQNGLDADEEVRLLSSAALMQLSSIYKSNPQYRPFDASD